MASFGVNPVSPEASKSWFLRKICPSSTGSKSTSHNHCAEVLGADQRPRVDDRQPQVKESTRQMEFHHGLLRIAGQARRPTTGCCSCGIDLFARKMSTRWMKYGATLCSFSVLRC